MYYCYYHYHDHYSYYYHVYTYYYTLILKDMEVVRNHALFAQRQAFSSFSHTMNLSITRLKTKSITSSRLWTDFLSFWLDHIDALVLLGFSLISSDAHENVTRGDFSSIQLTIFQHNNNIHHTSPPITHPSTPSFHPPILICVMNHHQPTSHPHPSHLNPYPSQNILFLLA